MNAAFVNIGLEKHAYLSYDDVPSSYRIHEGQAILVQVVKEAIDTKGPKLTANIEFTGNMSFICRLMRCALFLEK